VGDVSSGTHGLMDVEGAFGNPSLTSDGSDRDPLGRAPGEPLCPERYGVEWLEAARLKLGGYAFEALYQQNPSPAEGGRFKRAWFKKIVNHAPAGLRWKRGYDLAVSTKQGADFTASFRVTMDAEGNLYIADGFRAKIEYPEQRRYIVERMLAEADTEHGIEAAVHGKAVVQELRRDPALRGKAFREVRVAGDKLTRALAWLNLAEAGKVHLVRGAWIDGFVEEVAAFPTGRHDDQVDAVSTAVNMLVGAEKGKRAWGF
jgi:predicted phage terminase large subunit-like protein